MTTAIENRNGVGWLFWFQWVSASVAGMLIGVFLADTVLRPVLGPAIDQAGPGDWGSYFLTLAVAFTTAGTAIGLAQWLVLRRQIAQAGWWVLASASGFFGSIVVFEALHVPLSDRVLAVLGGAVIGLIQWLVLRHQISGSLWWVPATTLAIAAAEVVGGLAGRGAVVAWAAALGAITGGALIWLLRRSAAQVPSAA